MYQNQITYERAESFFATLRAMIQHENSLMNQRLTWMWTLHGFLFGSTAFLWNVGSFPVVVIAIVEVMSCIMIGYTCSRALNAIKRLLKKAKEYEEKLPAKYEFPPVIRIRQESQRMASSRSVYAICPRVGMDHTFAIPPFLFQS